MDSQSESLKGAFRVFDENCDGLVGREEFLQTLNKLGLQMSPEYLDSLLRSASGSRNSYVNFEEFQTLYESLCDTNSCADSLCSNERDEHCDLWDAFCLFDKNGDGFISDVELQMVLRNLGFCDERTDLSLCQDMIKRSDVNADGSIDFSEFRQMMSKDL
eukprot:c34198_g1_i1 orf=159-638(-)